MSAERKCKSIRDRGRIQKNLSFSCDLPPPVLPLLNQPILIPHRNKP